MGETGLQTALKGGEETRLETGNGHSKVWKRNVCPGEATVGVAETGDEKKTERSIKRR